MSAPKILRRNSLRLPGYDYSQPGLYFVTICTNNRRCLFGRISEFMVDVSNTGLIVQDCWMSIPKWFSNVALDQFVIMPNHLHGILQIKHQSHSLRGIIGSFKSAATRLCHQRHLSFGHQLWQRGYFDHVVRSEKALLRLRQYISNNPGQWHLDELNPAAIRQGDAWQSPLHLINPTDSD